MEEGGDDPSLAGDFQRGPGSWLATAPKAPTSFHFYWEGPHPSTLACPMATFLAGLLHSW